jgi:hypothetical protein
MLKLRPVEDQKYIAESMNLKTIVFPELTLSDEGISFKWKDKTIVMNPVKDSVLEVNGKRIDFAPGKLRIAGEEAAALLTQKKVSFLDMFISSAHADMFNDGGVIAVGGLIALVAGILLACTMSIVLIVGGVLALIGGVIASAMNYENDKKVGSMCDDARKKWNSIADDFTSAQIFEAKKAIVEARSKMISLKECLGGDRERMDICTQAHQCLNFLEKEMTALEGKENSSRGAVKEIGIQKAPAAKKKDSSKQ